MPLPNYGYHNKEDKKSQQMVFTMAPELVDEPKDSSDDRTPSSGGNSRKSSRAQVTTGEKLILCDGILLKLILSMKCFSI